MPNQLTAHDRAQMDLGQRARGWIVNSYAQFEHLLLDLIVRARLLPEYAAVHIPYRTDARIAAVRRLCRLPGPLAAFGERLVGLVDRFETFEKPRLLLVHGFCTVSIDDRDKMFFNFRQYRPTKDDPTAIEQRSFSLEELQKERNAFVDFAREAVTLFLEIHRFMGWEGLHPPDPAQAG